MTDIPPCNTLHISGITDSISAERVRESLYLLFATYGEVIDIKVNLRTMRHRAFITMSTTDSANLAKLAIDKQEFFGKPLSVQFSNSISTDL